MQLAYAPRKTSNPPPYAARSPKSQYLRRSRLQLLGLVAAAALFSIWLLSTLFRSSGAHKVPAGTPPVVLVTTIDRRASPASVANILDNRKDYASRH
ncbi:putative alpha-1,6-mannosyltransferase mnn11, partial [Cryomyces antarcticus]